MRVALSVLIMLASSACQPANSYQFASDVQVSGDAITAPLEGKSGDPDRGREIFSSRALGHCVLCHAIDGLDVDFQGDVGPALTNLGDRLTAEQIRMRIAGAQNIWPETVMPSYYRVDGLNRVGSEYKGKPALSAQQIEDLVAYLSSLKA